MSDSTTARAGAGGFDRLGREDLLARLRDAEAIIRRQSARIAELEARLGEAAASPQPTPRVPRRKAAPPVAEAAFTIVFDGGSLGNPGRGYGSYQIVDAGGAVVAEERLEYGDNVTNNWAEFRTLIAALERLLERSGDAARAGRVAVRGDSQLVINGVTGAWKIKHEDLKPLKERAARLLGEFGAADVRWQRRDQSVRVLGH